MPDHVATKRRKMSGKEKKEALTGYLFALPWLIGFFVFTLYPLLSSLYYSFTNYAMKSNWKWVGLTNYKILFTRDTFFWQTIGNTFYYALFYVPLNLILGLLIAMLMNQKMRGIRLFRTVFYMPNVISIVASCLLWTWMLQSKYGIINQALGMIGIEGPAWLADPAWSKPALILMSCWNAGSSMIIYLAGLQGIPGVYYEASRIDGAGTLKQFWNITLPMLSPTIFLNLINGIINALQIFIPALMITEGGPSNSTSFYVYEMYNYAFSDRRMGYASAMGWVMLLFTLFITLIVFKVVGPRVYYETGEN